MFSADANNTTGLGVVFHALPGLYLVISPAFIILDATDAYLRVTLQERHALIGKNIFDVFPNNPARPELNSEYLLRQSLEYVLEYKKPHTMPNVRYDIPCPAELGGGFTERYWSAVSTPVLDAAGNVSHILHETNDITEKLAGEFIQMHRQEQQLLLNSAVAAVSWEYNFKTDTMNWGSGLTEVFGYLPNTMEGNLYSWEKRVHPDDVKEITDSLEAATVAGSKVWTGEYRFLKADGTYTEVLDQSYIIYDGNGKPMLSIGTIIDVSKSKQAERHLKESDARFRHLLEVLPHMAWTAEPNGRGLYFNRGWYSYTGIREGHAESWIRAVHPEDSAFVLTSWHEALANKTMFEVEYRIRNGHDGKYRWFLERGVPMYEPDGKIKFWLGTFTDIDDHKEALEEVRRKDQRLERILQLSPVHICLLQGPRHICKVVTPGIYTMFGNRKYLGREALEIWPDLVKYNLEHLLDQVYWHGHIIHKKAVRLQVDAGKRGYLHDAFFDIKLQPIEDNEGNIEGVLCSAIEVSELVAAKEKLATLQAADTR